MSEARRVLVAIINEILRSRAVELKSVNIDRGELDGFMKEHKFRLNNRSESRYEKI